MTKISRQKVNKQHSGDNKTFEAQRESNIEVGNPVSSVLSKGKAERGDVIFSNEGPGGLALGNPIIMDKISSFLDNKDLCHWYGSSRIFKDIIEQMDDSTWRRRTQKLANALNTEIPPERTSREMFPIFKKEVDSLIIRIHGSMASVYVRITGLNLDLVTAAARLAHYGQIGFERLFLRHHDLSTVPGEHLCSLASSVRDTFDIMNIRGCDLVKIIDSVKCKKLCIFKQNLDKEATEAVVRAMDTRIELAHLERGKDIQWKLDMEALNKYNGKGRCRCIILWVGREDKYRQWLRDWAQGRDWSVINDGVCMIRVQRKTKVINLNQ